MLARWLRFLSIAAVPPLVVLLAAVLALQFAVKVGRIPAYEMPLPSDVARTLVGDRWEWLAALSTTAQAALIGFAASAVLGIGAGICLAGSRWARRAFYPYTLFFQTVPIVAIAPLLVFWFDYGLWSVAVSAFICSVFPVITSTLSGLRGTDPALLDLFTLYRASTLQRLWKLRLPSALPNILSGLRVAAGLAVIGAVVAEFLVGTLGQDEGLGVKIVGATKMGHPDRVFAAVLMASFLGLALFAGVNIAAHILLRHWHASEQPRE